MLKTFWQGKKILLTGHSGFKGTWLSLWLNKLGAEVIGYSIDPPSEINMFDLVNLKNQVKSIYGDVNDLEKLNQVIKNEKPEILIHMAAQSLVRKSYENPKETFMTNVMGTVNILEAVRASGSIKVVVNITSDKCYENKEWLWGYRENDSMGGYDPYSSSKGCSELVTSAYRQSFFNSSNDIALASCRAGNVIGGGDFAIDRLIPDIVRSAINNQVLQIRNPQAIRPWQHVLEPLSGYMTLIQKMYEAKNSFSEAWNFGPKDSDVKSVQWILENFSDYWEKKDKKISWKVDGNENPHEAKLLKLDCSKSNIKLNWSPKFTIHEALEMSVDWYHAYKNKENMNNFTLNQIDKY